MRVLVAYGSKRGGTAGLAGMIADELQKDGFDAVVEPAGTAPDPGGFDAVIVAGSLYNNGWHRDARRFVRLNTDALRRLPVWLVASGPLDDSALADDVAPVGHVTAAMGRIGARGQVTFGGRLTPDAKGFLASAMAKKMAGDWRDPAHVQLWVATVAAELARPAQPV